MSLEYWINNKIKAILHLIKIFSVIISKFKKLIKNDETIGKLITFKRQQKSIFILQIVNFYKKFEQFFRIIKIISIILCLYD
jgi:hypothetical protein